MEEITRRASCSGASYTGPFEKPRPKLLDGPGEKWEPCFAKLGENGTVVIDGAWTMDVMEKVPNGTERGERGFPYIATTTFTVRFPESTKPHKTHTY